ncbi:hypothetical protein TRAPUB_13621 [Trametes pubescens]|uniref:UspA domain-containing protein n=1 Tax=Trametes pubescens TaxID=154538 RepID=A0A1M2VQP3_TRAPU|nr:hypothetical protein TRAPUB_13621 [Trametes pubescens]
MSDRGKDRADGTRNKRSWIGKSSKEPHLPTTVEGKEQTYGPIPSSPLPAASGSGSSSSSGGILPFKRSNSGQSLTTATSPRPNAPLTSKKRSNSSTSLTQDEPQSQNALERTISTQSQPAVSVKSPQDESRASGSFSKMSLTSMLSSLTLTRSSGGDDERRGRSQQKEKDKDKYRSSSFAGSQADRDSSGSRARSQSPFHLRRIRTRDRDPSPTVEALSQSDVESDAEVSRVRPRNAFSLSGQSDDESGEETEDDSGSDEESWSEGDQELDDITEMNTERNALIPASSVDQEMPDYLGEGVNVIMPPEPYFPSTLNGTGGGRGPRRRKSTKPHDTMSLVSSRPVFQRDRCTITITHGDPDGVRQETGRPRRRYVLASDLSEESRFAMEWGIGTVLRDGDELIIVTVVENEGKIDPVIPNPADRATKLRAQQERQALAYILVRQATGLLQRTHLNVSIQCQAWHAKNSRHMILDIVDFYEPVMLIVGSRGLGNLKGILLGSTSHYLIQKCSVPVMVARRRLKRPPRRAAHLKAHRARVSLAQAAIDRVASKVDQDVANMRSEIERDDERRSEGHTDVEDDDDHPEDDQIEPEAVRTESPPPQPASPGAQPLSLGEKVAGD